MIAYVKKAGGKRFDRDAKPGFSRGPKKPFVKKSWGGGDRSDNRPTTFHKAICSKCGKPCEVPFRPVNGKPIFCRDCFVKTGDIAADGRAGDRFPRKDFHSNRDSSPRAEGGSNSEVLKQLEIMNAKLERLIKAVEEKQ